MDDRRNHVILLGIGLASMTLLAACGGSATSATPKPNSTPTSSTSASAKPHSNEPGSPKTSTSPGGKSATSNPPPTPPSSAPATEFSPPGDIPDNQVFVDYSPPGTSVHISVPEGWARSTTAGVTTFTDKLNSVGIQVMRQSSAPTVASAKSMEVPQLAHSVPQYSPGQVTRVQRQGGPAVLVTYQQDSAPDPVTGKVVRDAVERYEFWHSGQEAVLTLSGPVGADNVDPWQLVSDSLTWR